MKKEEKKLTTGEELKSEIDYQLERYQLIAFMASFPWERMSDGFLEEVAAFMTEHGFNSFRHDSKNH